MKNGAELTPQQQTAVDLLTLGQSITDTAAAVGANRATLSRWLNHDPEFQAALNLRQRELWREVSHRLRAMLPKALDVLQKALDAGDLNAALTMLRTAGPGNLAPTGPTDPAELRLEERERSSRRDLRSLLAQV